jgi:hypothetical protein
MGTRHACLLIAIAPAMPGAIPAFAQNYPAKPIRFVTGGGPDAMARLLGPKFTAKDIATEAQSSQRNAKRGIVRILCFLCGLRVSVANIGF